MIGFTVNLIFLLFFCVDCCFLCATNAGGWLGGSVAGTEWRSWMPLPESRVVCEFLLTGTTTSPRCKLVGREIRKLSPTFGLALYLEHLHPSHLPAIFPCHKILFPDFCLPGPVTQGQAYNLEHECA